MELPGEESSSRPLGIEAGGKLVSTKLHIPPLRSRVIYRGHLVDRLSAGRDCPLIVVCGPPGSGKTSLVCQWIKETGLRTAWYSLDESDNDPDLFLRYLITSLCQASSGLTAKIGSLMHAQARLSPEGVFPFLIEQCADISVDVYLVLDDYHLITSKGIHDSLAHFLNHAPPRMHLVVTSRHAVPFSLSQLRVRDQITEISAEEMRFSRAETERFFSEIIPVPLSVSQMDEISEHMEGWVGGLQLFGLSLRGKGVLSGINDLRTRLCSEVTDYLVDQVINGQPERVRRFLLATALLDRFNVDLCREVTGMEDAAEVLEWAFRNNLFLAPLDAARTWYRYHHLLSEEIRDQVSRSAPDEFAMIHRKAALWFARNGYLEDAFRHAFASEDLEFAADMLEDHLMDLFDRYEIASFRRWLSRLPGHVFIDRTLLRLQECRFNMEAIRLPEASALLRDIEGRRAEAFARYDAPKRQLCEDYLLLFKSILPYWLEPLKVNVAELEQAFGRISLQKTFIPGMMKVIVGSAYLFRGDLKEAGETARDATTTVLSSDSLFVKILWFRLMAAVERWQGRLRAAEAVLENGFSFLEQKGLSDSSVKFLLQFEPAWICYHRNELERAHDYAGAALKYLDQSGFVHEIVTGNFLLSIVLLAQGEVEAAARGAERIESVSRSSSESYVLAFADALCARLRVALGDLEWAEQWAEQRKLAPDEPFSYRFVHEYLAVAELLFAQRRYGETIKTLEMLRTRCGKHHMRELLLDADLLCCAALTRQGENERAEALLGRCLSLSKTEGYLTLFANRAHDLVPLLADYSTKMRSSTGPGHAHIERILEVCRDRKGRASQPEGGGHRTPGELTNREVEILRLLADGDKYREIADKCFISLDTVRTHVKHVFQKLGVESRIQAVRRATGLGILGG
jgi:LuxR family transcriptional regulator, maltose regulon positive regulatory protein